MWIQRRGYLLALLPELPSVQTFSYASHIAGAFREAYGYYCTEGSFDKAHSNICFRSSGNPFS